MRAMSSADMAVLGSPKQKAGRHDTEPTELPVFWARELGVRWDIPSELR